MTSRLRPPPPRVQAVAPGWTAKWLPEAKLIVMLRDPVQRTYSHFRMGTEWLRASKMCFTKEKDGRMAPVPVIRTLLANATSFAWQARLGIAEHALRTCKHVGMGWAAKEVGDIKVRALTDEQKACILKQPAGETVHAIVHAWHTANANHSDELLKYLNEGEKAINHCSELMLRPGAGVTRSYKYAENVGNWLKWFPAEQFKVVATEKLETDFEGTIREVVSFLKLKPLDPALLKDWRRYCVTSKAGIMDEKRVEAEKAGVIGAGKADKEGVGECDSGKEKDKGSDGISRYPIDSDTEKLLEAYFLPQNRRLYKMLGRDLGW